MVRPLIETGQLVALFPQLMKARRWHYLVYPERSRKCSGFMAFREWLLEEAAEFRAAPPIGFAGKHARSRPSRAPRRRAKAS
jgi:hypothetical protein